MKRIFTSSTILLIALALSTNLMAQSYSGGSGTSGAPYLISTTDDLIELSNSPDDWDASFKQTANIAFNANETLVDWDGDGFADGSGTSGFSPIGYSAGGTTKTFIGSYHGHGHTISHLFINRPGTDNIGLFGYTGFPDAATIDSLGLTDCNITGRHQVGAMVGINAKSTITECFSDGSVTGDNMVGGLVGWYYDDIYTSQINNCYSTASVTGNSNVGGLVGGMNYYPSINNSYSTGSVPGSGSQIGGLLGYNDPGNKWAYLINKSFWDTETSGTITGIGLDYSYTAEVTGNATDEMTTASTFIDADWVFCPSGSTTGGIWTIDESETTPDNNGYPALAWQGLTNNYTTPSIITNETDCPEDIEVDNDSGLCGAKVVYTIPSPDGAVVTQFDESGLTTGDTFPIGTTLQEFAFDYAVGNDDTCSFYITVNDTEDPIIDCLDDIEVDSDPDICGAVVSFGKITFSASFIQNEILTNCTEWEEFRAKLLPSLQYTKLTVKGTYDEEGVSISDPEKVQQLAEGLYLGTDVSITDDDRNWSTGYCGEGVGLSASASSTCQCQSPGYDVRPCLENNNWGGVNTQTCKSPSQDITVEFEIGNGEILASDNCDFELVQTEGLPSGSEFPIGTTTNTFKATDASGNTSYCSFDVTVNNIAPNLVVNPIEVELYANGEYVLTKDDIEVISAGTTDNCDDYEDLTITVFPKSFECVHVGEPVNVKVTATDKLGESSSKWTTITVYDETPPVALCKDLDLVLDADGKARINPSKVNGGDGTVVLPGWARTYNDMSGGSYDACGISLLNIDQYNFDCSDVGENTVTLTVVDGHGNTSTCESTVTVSDNMIPVIEPVDDVELVIEPGNCDSELEYPTLVVNDNCETTLELTEGLGPDGVFPVGTTTETWLATDDAGNTASVSFDITIIATNAMPTVDDLTDITVAEDTYSIGVTLTGITEGADCEEQDVTVTATGDNAELITSVTVDYITGDSTGTITMMVAPEISGEAEIIVTVEDEEGGTTTDTFMVTVTAVNDAPVLLHAIADETVNASYELKVPISSVLGEIFDDVDDDVLTIEVVAEGTDSLPNWAMMMGDTLVCTPAITDTSCVNIVVTATDAGGLSVSDTFEVCIDGYPVSISDLGMNKFEVQMYPNPTRGKVNMDISSGIYDVQLSVMDITGKVVLQKQYSASENITFDMSGKVSGMYFVKMNIDGKQIVKKLIVDRK